MASTKVNVHPAVCYLIEAIAILSYTVKPSPYYRWCFFVLITSIACYVLIFYRLDLIHLGLSETGESSRFIQLTLFASTNLLLSDAQNDLRLVGQQDSISNAPFLSRLWWGIIVWGNPRGINFTHEPTSALPPRPTQKTRIAFVLWQLRSILFHLLIFDVNGMMLRANPYYTRNVPEVVGYQQLWRLAGFGYAVSIHALLTIELKVLSLICVPLHISSPCDWIDLADSLLEGYTIGRMWGKAWHQMFRRPCIMHADFFASKLGLSPKARSTGIFKLFICFLITGLLHYFSDAVTMQSLTKSLGCIIFFLLQPIGIILEDIALRTARRTGLVRMSARSARYLGYVWVFLWFNLTLPIWTDALYMYSEWLDVIPHFSIILGLWNGTWVPVNKPTSKNYL